MGKGEGNEGSEERSQAVWGERRGMRGEVRGVKRECEGSVGRGERNEGDGV